MHYNAIGNLISIYTAASAVMAVVVDRVNRCMYGMCYGYDIMMCLCSSFLVSLV